MMNVELLDLTEEQWAVLEQARLGTLYGTNRTRLSDFWVHNKTANKFVKLGLFEDYNFTYYSITKEGLRLLMLRTLRKACMDDQSPNDS